MYDSEFLSRLESCQCDPVLIARCFTERAQHFSVYSTYCTNYPRYDRLKPVLSCSWQPRFYFPRGVYTVPALTGREQTGGFLREGTARASPVSVSAVSPPPTHTHIRVHGGAPTAKEFSRILGIHVGFSIQFFTFSMEDFSLCSSLVYM